MRLLLNIKEYTCCREESFSIIPLFRKRKSFHLYLYTFINTFPFLKTDYQNFDQLFPCRSIYF